MKHNEYLKREWQYNKPVPMDEAKLDKLIKEQAKLMRTLGK